MKNREKLLQDFLSKSDWDQANRQSIASDASGRTYERLTLNSSNAILMNAPYSAGEDVKPFVAVTHMLKKLNLSAPIIYNKDIKNGLSTPPKLTCLLYTSPSPRDATLSRMPSSA